MLSQQNSRPLSWSQMCPRLSQVDFMAALVTVMTGYYARLTKNKSWICINSWWHQSHLSYTTDLIEHISASCCFADLRFKTECSDDVRHLVKDKRTCAMQKVTKNVIGAQNRNTDPCGQYFTTTIKQWTQTYIAYHCYLIKVKFRDGKYARPFNFYIFVFFLNKSAVFKFH